MSKMWVPDEWVWYAIGRLDFEKGRFSNVTLVEWFLLEFAYLETGTVGKGTSFSSK